MAKSFACSVSDFISVSGFGYPFVPMISTKTLKSQNTISHRGQVLFWDALCYLQLYLFKIIFDLYWTISGNVTKYNFKSAKVSNIYASHGDIFTRF